MRLTATIAAFCVIGAASHAAAGPENASMGAMIEPVRAVGAAQGTQESPWFQRFTFGSGYSSDLNGWSSGAVQNDTSAMRVTTQGKRWGMTLGVRDKKDWAPLDQSGARDRISAGAFYNLTPRVRFGGEMTFESKSAGDALVGRTSVEPGVKLESAFRF